MARHQTDGNMAFVHGRTPEPPEEKVEEKQEEKEYESLEEALLGE